MRGKTTAAFSRMSYVGGVNDVLIAGIFAGFANERHEAVLDQLMPRGMRPGRDLLHALGGVVRILALVALSGCSDLAMPKEAMPAMGIDPSYGSVIAGYIRTTLKDSGAYDAFEIAEPRWVHSVKGWSWLVCVRFQDRGKQRSYAFFIQEKSVVDARYAVQSDACGAQAYSPFNLVIDPTGPGAVGGQGPLY